ncbi:MAG: cupin domain-containing protein [Ferruginibacter sp.]
MNNIKTVNSIGANSIFTKSAIKTKADYAEMETTLPVCNKAEVLHIHPMQTTKLEVLDGNLGIILPDRRLVVTSGHGYEIPKNIEHAFYNADEKPIRFKAILEPALHIEWLAKEMVATKQRKQSKLMSTLEYSYILHQVKGEYYRSGIPIAIQRMMHPVFSFFAKAFGIDKRVSLVN